MHQDLAAILNRLRDAANGAHAYYVNIAAPGMPCSSPLGPAIQWLGSETAARTRWRALVTARQRHPRA
ncbi:hypothetical protein ACFYWU_34425 [Streptomyces chrestomyceticus]|uniref:hypothetical protein n=1 Tax=Streptomyces chrestomyceticus TaxID=68185 RepID=UPI003675CB85